MVRVLGLLLVSALIACAPQVADQGGDDSELAPGTCGSGLFNQIAAGVTATGAIPQSLALTTRNAARPEALIGGAQIFGAAADLIASAEHDVELQTWRWDVGSDPSQRLLDGLKRLEGRRRDAGADRPVVVRLLVNRVSVQSPDLTQRISAELAKLALDATLVDVQLVEFLASGLGANHAKTISVDGHAAIVTGANVAFGYGESPDWWDAGFRFSGEVVQAIHADFAATWMKGRRWLCGTELNPQGEPLGDAPQSTPAAACWGAPATVTTLDATRVAGACVPMLVATHPENGALFPRVNDDNAQAQLFLGALGAATTIARVQSPNLNETSAVDAILAAVRRGVTVQLLLSKGFEQTGESLPGRGGNNDDTVAALGAALADSPDALARLDIRWYSLDGTTPVEATAPPASHVKYLSVDGQVAIVGSANLDVQSWRNSHELNVAVDDAGLTAAWDLGLFEDAWDRAVSAAPYGG